MTVLKVIPPYVLDVTFEDGVHRRIDMKDFLFGEVFEPLRDPKLFAQVTVDETWHTVVWPNGADLAPEFLYGEPGDYPKKRK